MLIELKKVTKSLSKQIATLVLNERLPSTLQGPLSMQCEYTLQKLDAFYLLKLSVCGELTIACQRCLDIFTYSYKNQSKLAICSSEELAERLMTEYDSIVSMNDHIDLNEIVTDELHLYAPEFHRDFLDCNDEIKTLFSAR